MTVALFAPLSFLNQSHLAIFQVIVINQRYAGVLGLSSTGDFEVCLEYAERFNLPHGTTLVIQNPVHVLPAKTLTVNLVDPITDRVAELIEASLLYRLQGSHILLGGHESFRVLGNRVTVLYVEAESSRIFSADDKLNFATMKLESASEFDLSQEKRGWNFQFNSNLFRQEVFKIGPSTKLYIQYKRSNFSTVGVNLPYLPNQRNPANKANSNSILYGLDGIFTTLVECLKNFALTTSQTADSVPRLEVENGVLLYGLPGCGKRSLLNSIADRTHPELVGKTWCDNLVFVILTPDVIHRLYTLQTGSKSMMNEIIAWISKHLANESSDTPSAVVLVWPNIDQPLGTQLNTVSGDAEDDGDEHNSSSNSTKFSLLLRGLIEAFSLLNRGVRNTTQCRFLMLATAESMDSIFNYSDCRKLFYRRLLVSLPNAQCRFRILKEYLELRVADHWLLKKTTDLINDDDLIHIASKLHGYTPRDLIRLGQVSYAAFVSELSPKNHLESNSSKDENQLSPTSNHRFYEILLRESKFYLPINLSQHVNHFEPLNWADIGGYQKLKSVFQNTIEKRFINAAKPDSLEAQTDANLGLRVPRGILLHGPPGCSKTMFVRALATECMLPLIAVQASRIFGRYVGDSERNMRKILVQVRASAPAILFIDEIDLLLPSRSSSETGASEHVLSEVLTAMDGVEGQSGQVILIGATNRMDKLDSALCRAGRFDLVIEVPAPDEFSRADILQMELSRRSVGETCLKKFDWLLNFSIQYLNNYTGAEVVRLVGQAAQLAREDKSDRIRVKHLRNAVKDCPPSTLINYSTQFNLPNLSTNNTKYSKSSSTSCTLLIYFISILVVFGAFIFFQNTI